MNIKGLDYNTDRQQLILPEYGREIQEMVNHALTIRNRAERQRCAETIVKVMRQMVPANCAPADYTQKLWDSLALMSDFKLDIDYPVDIDNARKAKLAPQPMDYPMQRIPVRHYGHALFEMFEKLKTMEPGEARDRLMASTANQMKRCLVQWSHGSSDNEKVADDLARYTNGKIQLPADFRFEPVVITNEGGTKNKKKK